MAPHLPRVGAFPIFAENHPFTVAATSTELPITIRKVFPLKDQPPPEFVLSDHLGRQCSLHDTMKLGRPIILFFFPLAGSPHCTKESCLFRDAIEVTPVFSALQAIVIGISQDPPERAKRFADEHQLSYPVLYDHKRKVMDLYGVGRTTFGLVDNRATFIIDPSGIVRGLAEGVLNANGHLKFAERWLIRLEHELSERSRKYLDYVAKEGDMIANMDNERDKVIQVVYGEEKSAEHGGIDGVPRHGAASVTPLKLPSSPGMVKRKKSLDRVRASRLRPEKQESVTGGLQDRNMWKNWKYFLSQLSSPDGVPPPVVVKRWDGDDRTELDLDQSPGNSSRSRGSIRSVRSNPAKALSPRRSKSPFGKRLVRSNDEPAPPLPQPHSRGSTRQNWADYMDADSRDVRTASGADNTSGGSSLKSYSSSNLSHTRMGSHSSKTSTNAIKVLAASGSSNGHLKSSPQLATPSVTSEVLMADAPIVMRIVPNKQSSSPSVHSFSQQVGPKYTATSPAQAQREESRVEKEIVPRRSVGPSDVPEDASPDEEDIANITDLQKPLPLTPGAHTTSRGSTTSSVPSDTPESSQVDFTPNMTPSRKDSFKGRRGKRSQPPVVSSQYGSATWDSAYGRSDELRDSMGVSSDSESTMRPKHQSAAAAYSTSSNGHEAGSTDTASLNHPFSNSRHSQTTLTHKGVGSFNEHRRTPTPSSSGHGGGGNLILQSLSSNNASQHSLVGSSGSHAAPSEDGRLRLIPRKAPPPMYAPPQPPPLQSKTSQFNTSHSPPEASLLNDQQDRYTNPLTQISSRSSSREEHSSNHAYLSSFQSASRRASATSSIQSTGTFG